MKMPVRIRKKVTRIQRDFLWGGVNGTKKLSWIKWKVVCKDKKKGGLGVRDLEVMNTSLLLKWRWRLLNREDSPLWKEVLVAKYGNNIVNNVRLSLEEVVVRRLGNGRQTRFWRDVWIGDAPLCIKFPRLFSISLQKDASVGELLKVEEDRRWWDFHWRRNLFQWEVVRVDTLVDFLVNVTLSISDDGWIWAPNPDDGFSVKSAYDSLVECGESSTLSVFEVKIFSSIWESFQGCGILLATLL
jgi:hypothetical protein